MRTREAKLKAAHRQVLAPIIARYLVSGLALGLLGGFVLTFSWSQPRSIYKRFTPLAVSTALSCFRRPFQQWLKVPEEPKRSYVAASLGGTLLGLALGMLPAFLVTGEAARTGDMVVLCALVGAGSIVYGFRTAAKGL